nr:ORF1 [Anelloviridae sp.]
MAYPGRFKRRAKNRRWRQLTWRRRYRRTYPGFRRRSTRVRRHLRHAKWINRPHKTSVKQWTPKNIRKCTIIGWTPTIVGTWGRRANFWDSKEVKRYTGGGIGQLHFTLHRLFNEHLKHRNWWTETNDGTDLCQYLGTKLYLYPNEKYSYIIYWDREYGTEDKFPLWKHHPALMFLNPQHRIIWSRQTKGNRAPTKLWMPPPAVTTNEWYFQKSYADYGMFALTISLIDLTDPFMAENDATYKAKVGTDGNVTWQPKNPNIREVNYDIFHDDGRENLTAFNHANWTENTYMPGDQDAVHKMEYWGAGYPIWCTLWCFEPELVSEDTNQGMKGKKLIWIKWYPPKNVNDPTPDFQQQKQWTILNRAQVAIVQKMGPFVQKQFDSNFSIFLKYKSFWRWGGLIPDVTDQYNEPVADATKATRTSFLRAQVPVRDPTTQTKNKHYITALPSEWQSLFCQTVVLLASRRCGRVPEAYRPKSRGLSGAPSLAGGLIWTKFLLKS